jgi:predicted kinase
VILDASFGKRAERQRMAVLAQEMGAECYILECWAPEAVLRARLRARECSPASISDAREVILSQFQRDFEPLQAEEGAEKVRIDTTEHPEQCIQEALAAIHEHRR